MVKKPLYIIEGDQKQAADQSLEPLTKLFGSADFLVLEPQLLKDMQRPIQLRGGTEKAFKIVASSIPESQPPIFHGFGRLLEWLEDKDYTQVLRLRLDGFPFNKHLLAKFWQGFQKSGQPYGSVAVWNAFLPGMRIDALKPAEIAALRPDSWSLFPDGHLYLPNDSYEYELDLKDRAFYFDTHFDALFGRPHTLQMELASICNSRCPKCLFHGGRSPIYHPHTESPAFMAPELFKKIIDEFSTFKPRTGLAAALSYRGESLLHPDFFELLDFTRKKDVRAVINTNGRLLNRETVLKLLDLDLTAISISLDSLNQKKQRVLQGGDVNQIKRDLDFLLEQKAKRGLKRPVLTSISVISKENEDELPELLEFLLARCEQVACFGYMDITSRSLSAPHTYFNVPERYPCPHPWEILTVLSSGKALRCGYDLNHEAILGDLNQETIVDIWNSTKMQTDRKNMCTGNDAADNLCCGCPRWEAVFRKLSIQDGIMVTTQWEGKTLQVLNKDYTKETFVKIFSDRPQSVFLPGPVAS